MSALALRTLAKTLRPSEVSSLRTFHWSARRNKHFLNANEATFEEAITNKDNVVLVDFYADWCGPCKMLSPILEKLTTDPSIKSGSGLPLDLVTVDTDTETALALKYKIRSLPTVIAFKDGQPISQFMGAVPEAHVRNFLTAL
ncbi:Thioredoxin [Sparassis crispa]|uniref:Thioredoxin n=1 Tax=Sparassis crispa TaxID=139825 RepID=A0A401GI44_9APHY|nr:Thioredoxin [Sparassis crispa]GBE81781.1 Thioredoxin [Sparassis crispa]